MPSSPGFFTVNKESAPQSYYFSTLEWGCKAVFVMGEQSSTLASYTSPPATIVSSPLIFMEEFSLVLLHKWVEVLQFKATTAASLICCVTVVGCSGCQQDSYAHDNELYP